MREWVALYRQHQALRGMHDRDAANELRAVLRNLSEKPCALFRGGAQSRLVEKYDRASGSVTYTLGHGREGEALTLGALPEPLHACVALSQATLTVLLRFDRRSVSLSELNVMLSGTRRDGAPLALAVHLPHDKETRDRPNGDREGLGACGHAALHCHVGPTLDAEPKVRVPFPPLRPAQVVEWVVSQVVPTPEFEPAPWNAVEAVLRPS